MGRVLGKRYVALVDSHKLARQVESDTHAVACELALRKSLEQFLLLFLRHSHPTVGHAEKQAPLLPVGPYAQCYVAVGWRILQCVANQIVGNLVDMSAVDEPKESLCLRREHEIDVLVFGNVDKAVVYVAQESHNVRLLQGES